MSGESRSTADRLFETLETTTRIVAGGMAGNGRDGHVRPDFVLTDTVGFIRKLPTQLVHSFAGTLEAARDADVIVLCADASSERIEEEIKTVEDTLAETLSGNGASPKEIILCLNKVDLVSEERRRELTTLYPGAALISAMVDPSPLLDAVNEALARSRVRMQLLIPHAEYGAASGLYGRAEIHAHENTMEGLKLDVTLPKPQVSRYTHYRTA